MCDNFNMLKKDLEPFFGQKVVLDTNSSWLYVGALKEVTEHSAILTEVDVHNKNDSTSSQELYVLESKTTGIAANRNRVFVNLDYVVSFSLLDDVKHF